MLAHNLDQIDSRSFNSSGNFSKVPNPYRLPLAAAVHGAVGSLRCAQGPRQGLAWQQAQPRPVPLVPPSQPAPQAQLKQRPLAQQPAAEAGELAVGARFA